MRIKGTMLLPMMLLISGASSSSSAHRSGSLDHVEAEGCSLPAGWDQIAARKPRFVVLGELHGTQEAPAFLGNLACGLTSRGKRILVAIEHSSTENVAFQEAWKLPGAKFTAALKQAGWAGRGDGIASNAMADLLVRLHSLREGGHFIDIVAFNGARDEAQASRFSHLPAQEPHEAAQAGNIRAAASAKLYDYVLVLVGNVHARKRPVERSGVAFKPMAMQLAPATDLVTLNMETAGGTAWNCQLKPGVKPDPKKPIADDAIACGSYPVRGSTDRRREPFVELAQPSVTNPHADYDGVFWLGKVSASAPAVP